MIDHRELLKKYIYYMTTKMPVESSRTFFTAEEREEMNSVQDDSIRQYSAPEVLEKHLSDVISMREKLDKELEDNELKNA